MNKYPTDIHQKILSLCGIIGPIVYSIVLNILGALWDGYSHIKDSMSELGAVDAPHGPIMQFIGFSLLGIFIILFSFGVYRGVRTHRVTIIGVLLLFIAGIFMAAVGFYPCDSQCIDVTFTGRMHSFTAMIPAITMPWGILLLNYPMQNDPNWQGLWHRLTLILGIISVILAPMLMLSVFDPVIGLIQRLGIFIPLLWMFLSSIHLFRLAS